MHQGASIRAITLRNLPEAVEAAILARAERDRLSFNKVVIQLLEEAIAAKPTESPPGPPYHDLDRFFGMWTEEEANEFDHALNEQRTIEPNEWS